MTKTPCCTASPDGTHTPSAAPPPTSLQGLVLCFYRAYQTLYRRAPTLREAADWRGVPRSAAESMQRNLIRKGYLSPRAHRCTLRAFEVLWPTTPVELS